MPLIYNGQEIGLDRRLEFFEKDPIIWPEPFTNEWETFYKRLVELRTQNPALFSAGGGGLLKALHLENTDVIAFSRSVPGNTVLVFANLSSEPQTQAIEPADLAGDYVDWFTNEVVSLEALDTVQLAPNSFKVLVQKQGS